MSLGPVTIVSSSPAPVSAPESIPADSTPAPEPAPKPQSAATPAAKAAPAPTTPSTEVDIDAGELKQWTALARANREAKATIAQLEKDHADLKAKAEAKPTIANLKAAREAGIAIEDLFSEWMAEQAAGTSAPPPKELVELKEEVDRLKAKDADAEKARKEQDEAGKTAALKQSEENVKSLIADVLAEDGKPKTDKEGNPVPPKWRRCAKEPDAVADARVIAIETVKALKREVSNEEALAIFGKALDQLEAHYKELGSRYAVDEVPPRTRLVKTQQRTARVADPVVARQPSLTIDSNRGTTRQSQTAPKPHMSPRQAKQAMLDRAYGR